MKYKVTLLVAFITIIVLLSFSYGFIRHFQKESVNVAISQELEHFRANLDSTNRLYFSFGLLAYNLFINDSTNTEAIDKLAKEREESSTLFLKSAKTHFSTFQSTLLHLNINFIHLHSQDAESFLRLGLREEHGDSLKERRPDVVYVQDFKIPLQSYELGRHGLLLRNIFPLSNFKKVESIEFSTTLSQTLETMIQFSDAEYGAYIPYDELYEAECPLCETLSRSEFFKNWLLVKGTNFNEEQLIGLSQNDFANLKKSINQGEPFGTLLREGKEIKFLGLIPIFSAVDKKLIAYIIKSYPSHDIALLKKFFFKYYLLAAFFIFLFVGFGCWIWRKKIQTQDLYEALASQKSDTEALIKHAQCGIASIDASGKIIQGNEKFAQLFDSDQELLSNHNFFNLIGLEKEKAMRNGLKEEHKYSFKHQFVNLSNKPLEVDILASKIPNKDSIFLIVISRKEKKALELTLKRLNLYFNHSALGYIILDESLNIIDANESFCTITEYERSEILGKSIKTLFSTEKLFNTWQNDKMAPLANGEKGSYECKLRRKNGAIFWAEMFGNSFENESFKHSIWSIKDISVRVDSRNIIRRLNDRLKEQFDELEMILDIVPMPIMIKDKNLVYKWCNKTFRQFFNLDNKMIIGKKTSDIFPKNFSKTIETKDAKMNKMAFQRHKLSLIDPQSKKERILEFHMKSISKDGFFDGIVSVAVDITEKEKQKALLEEQVKSEVEKNILALKLHQDEKIKDAKFSSIGKMAAGITHEINSPLTYVKGNIEMLQMDIEKIENEALRESMKNDIATTLEGIERIASIIESMRESSQKSSEEPERINIYETLISALTLSYNRTKQITRVFLNGTIFDMDLSKNSEVFISKAQRQRLEQVWIIILSNALDELVKIENFEKRNLFIKIWEDEEKIYVSFEDNAGGIHPEILSQVFDPFVSIEKSQGIGIGLNIAQRIIKDQNGEIHAYNTKEGALFKVSLKKEEDVRE